jgi:hypothetical protein
MVGVHQLKRLVAGLSRSLQMKYYSLAATEIIDKQWVTAERRRPPRRPTQLRILRSTSSPDGDHTAGDHGCQYGARQ